MINEEKRLHTEDMWCFHCDYRWTTKDYFNENICPNCKKKPVRIYRESSTVYAYFEKNEKSDKKIWFLLNYLLSL